MLRNVGVVIPAAGRGARAGSGTPKQLRPLGGVPMLLRALRPFAAHPRVREIAVALPEDIVSHPPAWLAELTGERLHLVSGAGTRSASVARALAALAPECNVVLVHDAARPFVSRETIDDVLRVVDQGRAAVAAIPVGDTLKRADPSSNTVVATVDRTDLWRAQTPQGFPREALERGVRFAQQSGQQPTDDAGLVESVGVPVVLVPDRTSNFKVTTPDDLEMADLLASQ